MPNLSVITKNTVQRVRQHSPAILTGAAIVGVVTTVALTVRATTRANQTIAANQYVTSDQPLTTKEKLRLVWPIYIPPAAMAVATVGCIIGAQSINVRRQAALLGAFTLTEGAFQEYKDQVAEQLTKPAKEKLESAVSQRRVDENPPSTELLMQADGKVLVLDLYTGRYFRSTQEAIRAAQNDINERLTVGGEDSVSLNEFYLILGLESSIIGEVVGFTPTNLLDINFNTAIAEGGVPCLTISFRALPASDYDSLH